MKRPLQTISIYAVVLLATLSTATAEIPKTTQAALQQAAPERLAIEVTKVAKKQGLTGRVDLEVEAKVVGVKASRTGLKRDDTIVIRYWIHNPNLPAPSHSAPSEVKQGKKYHAYLGPPKDHQKHLRDPNRQIYFPQAASGSFVRSK